MKFNLMEWREKKKKKMEGYVIKKFISFTKKNIYTKIAILMNNLDLWENYSVK